MEQTTSSLMDFAPQVDVEDDKFKKKELSFWNNFECIEKLHR